MTSFSLKIIALITMFCDHFGDAYLGHFSFLNLIGRLAFPIFAFQISEGYMHTRNIKKYFLRLSVFALISQIPFSLFSYKFLHSSVLSLNVFFTLLLGLLAIYLFDFIVKTFKEKSNNLKFAQKYSQAYSFINVFLGFIIVIILAYVAELINADYGFWGVIVVFMFYILKNKKLITTITFFVLCVIKYLASLMQSNFHILYILIILFTFLPIIFINSYTGKQGIKLKYLLYIFYPVHLLLLYCFF